MAIRVECDVPAGDESFPFGDLFAFVEHARAAGAKPDTPILAVTAPQDDSIVVALRVELDLPPAPAHRSEVRLDGDDVAQLLAVFESIEANEGDARAELSAIQELRHRLTSRALGTA